MSIQTQVCALMSRHLQMIKKRRQSMLGRVIAEIGLDADCTSYYSHTQGLSQTSPCFFTTYDRK